MYLTSIFDQSAAGRLSGRAAGGPLDRCAAAVDGGGGFVTGGRRRRRRRQVRDDGKIDVTLRPPGAKVRPSAALPALKSGHHLYGARPHA